MTPADYLATFEQNKEANPSYSLEFQEYILLNKSRFKRWTKLRIIRQDLAELIKSINETQYWIIITEPWCGDAAQTLPFLFKLAEMNTHIQVDVQLRDVDSEIDAYLTKGKKSIPILIARNKQGIDLFHWGPRPKKLALLISSQQKKSETKEALKISEQKWYNEDKGQSLQIELLEHLLTNRT